MIVNVPTPTSTLHFCSRTAVRLADAAAFLAATFPSLPSPDRPPALVVLADDDRYRRYVQRLGRAFNAEVAVPESDGFTLQGVAVGAWDPARGTSRPSWTHEYAHAWLADAARFSSGTGDWFQEGTAALVQLHVHPQADYPDIVCQGLRDPQHRMPLPALVDGRRLPTKRYWQAATVVEHLLAAHGERVPALLEAFYATGSVDLGPHLEPVLGTSAVAFEDTWMAATSRTYCGDPASPRSEHAHDRPG
jgi:hypothetical protein